MPADEALGSQGAGAQPHGAHVFVVRVYFEDTDAAGIVYYANYLKYAERARTEMLRDFGVAHAQLIAEEGRAFAVRSCTAEFIKPARLDDVLEVHTRLTTVRRASLDLSQDIKRHGVDLVTLRFGLAFMSLSGRAARIPPALRTTFERYWQQDRLSG